jgi:hypothetical protein
MSRLDDLPPDQKAALSLLLRRRESYADLAAVLNISERAVHDRAHAALAMLAPAQARSLTAEQREQVGEYLLGQQRVEGELSATRRLLEDSGAAREWARALAAELAPVGDGAIPQLPREDDGEPQPVASAGVPPASAGATAPPAPVATATPASKAAAKRPLPAARSSLPVSRPAGAALLAVLVAGVIVAAIVVPSGGGGAKNGAPGARTSPPSRGQSASTAAANPTQDRRIVLRPAQAGSHAFGVALVLSESGKYAFYLAAEKMAPTSGFFYAVWLYGSPTSSEALGKSPAVGSDGRLQGGALLPADAGNFHRIIVTRETSEHPTRPGPIVLSGAFGLH